MKRNDKEILRDILRDVKNGYSYGKDYTYVPYPYFGAALYLTPFGNVGYTHYGSSAIKPTLKDLEWLITTIFRTTPEGFLRDYIRNDQSKAALTSL